MTEKMPEKNDPAASPFAEQLNRSPRENARDAEREMGEAEKRREVEQAQANKEEALKDRAGDALGDLHDVNTARSAPD